MAGLLFGFLCRAGAAEPYLAPAQVIDGPDDNHSVASRKFQGIPSLAIAPGGRLWATWYAGPTPAEDRNNYVVVSTSADGGRTWAESHAVDPDGPGPVRAFDPQMWIDPKGRLWSFWAQASGHDGTVAGVWAMTAADPNAASPTWSKPRRLTDGVMMGKPLVLSSGQWLLPASTWRKTDNSARLVASDDGGRTWQLRGACHVPKDMRSFDEHLVVERADKSLWMLVRTSYGIGQSVSTDRGRTWAALAPSAIQHPSARFFVRRLRSGRLLLVKHGPLGQRTGRSHLTAYLSEDDGKTWKGGLLLDERDGVSYPDGQQASDGTVCIVYDYARTRDREILMARFSESDVLSGNADSGRALLRIRVSKAP